MKRYIILLMLASSALAQPDNNIEHLATRMFTVSCGNGVIRDSLLYLVCNEFAVYDISIPNAPVERGYTKLPFGLASSIILEADLALIMHPAGIATFDISDTWHIRLIDTVNVDNPFSMALENSILYVSLPGNKLNTYRFDREGGLTLLYEDDIGDTLRCLTIHNDLLLAGGRQFKVYSLEEPTNPYLIGYQNVNTYDIVAKNGYAYVARYRDGVEIYQLFDDATPELRNSIDINAVFDVALWQGNLMICEQRIYANDGSGYSWGHAKVYNIDNPESPNLIGFVESPAPGGFFYRDYTPGVITGDYPVCYLLNYGWLIDINRKSNWNTYIPQFSQLGSFGDRSIMLAGGYLYVLRSHGNIILYCFDVSNPINPVQVSVTPMPNYSYFIAGNERYLFICEGYDRRQELKAYEIGVNGSLRLVPGAMPTNVYAWWRNSGGKVYDEYILCKARDDLGFVEVDIRNTTYLRETIFTTDNRFERWTYDSERRFIYYADPYDDQINCLNISNPQQPYEMERIHTLLPIRDLFYENYRLYVSTRDLIIVYDVNDPDDVSVLTIYDPQYLLDVKDNHMYYYTKYRNDPLVLHMLDVADPLHPNEAGVHQSDEANLLYIIINGSLLVSNNVYSINFYDVSRALPVPSNTSLHFPQILSLSAFPNPFNARANITFDLPVGSNGARLTVVDPLGRVVKDLTPTGWFGAGRQMVVWDANGVAAGSYFLKLNTVDRTVTKRLTLVK